MIINLVVSTVVSGILFARFPTVECISKGRCFLLGHHSCTKSGGKSRFSLLFLSDIRRKLYTVGTHSTIKNEQKECQILQSRLLTFALSYWFCSSIRILRECSFGTGIASHLTWVRLKSPLWTVMTSWKEKYSGDLNTNHVLLQMAKCCWMSDRILNSFVRISNGLNCQTMCIKLGRNIWFIKKLY